MDDDDAQTGSRRTQVTDDTAGPASTPTEAAAGEAGRGQDGPGEVGSASGGEDPSAELETATGDSGDLAVEHDGTADADGEADGEAADGPDAGDHEATDGDPSDPSDPSEPSDHDRTAEEGERWPGRRTPSRGRSAAFAVTRAAVVLAVAAVGYQAVVPVHHVSRARLARLVPAKPGLAAFNSAQGSGAEQPAAQAGLAAIKTAGAKSPNQTGIYTIGWQVSQASGAGLAVFLFPTSAQAQSGLTELISHQLSATAFQADGLKRQATFTVATVPGSSGAVFVPSKGASPGLALVAFREGRVLAASEVFSLKPAQADATTLAVNEFNHLRSVGSGFSLEYTTHPATATALWAAGSVALAAFAAFAPAGWRWQRRRRQRRIEEELASRVVVGGQVIHKRRL